MGACLTLLKFQALTPRTRPGGASPPALDTGLVMPIEAGWAQAGSTHPRHFPGLLVDAPSRWDPAGGGMAAARPRRPISRLHRPQVVLLVQGLGGVALSERILSASDDGLGGGAQPGQ